MVRKWSSSIPKYLKWYLYCRLAFLIVNWLSWKKLLVSKLEFRGNIWALVLIIFIVRSKPESKFRDVFCLREI